MSDVIGIREIEAFGHFYIFECLNELGLLFLVVWRCVSNRDGASPIERLDNYVLDLIDVVSAYLCDLLLLCNHDYVIALEKLDEAKQTVSFSDHNADTLDVVNVVIELVSVKHLRLLDDDILQSDTSVSVRSLHQLHG